MKRTYKRKTQKSPVAYKPGLKVYSMIPYEENKDIEIEVFDIQKYKAEIFDKSMDICFFFSKGNYYKENVVESKKFKTFLCELDMFNWKIDAINTFNNIQYFLLGNYTVYISYLCNQFGNNLTFFGRILCDSKYKMRIPPYGIMDGTFSFMNEGKYFHSPITVIERKDHTFNFYYTNEIIKNNSSRYVLATVVNYDSNTTESHFSVLFIDKELKKIEYYDPHGRQTNRRLALYIHQVLKMLFPEYTINEHWKNIGIQIDVIEQTYSNIKEEGFCTVWGCLMIHLKLLNMRMSFQDIELSFIKECFEKNLSLFEVMLNYAHFMTRIISKDQIKYNKLEKIVEFNN